MPVKLMAAKLLYGHQRADVCRMLVNITRTLRDCYAPDLALGEVADLMWVLCNVFIGHANNRPPSASKLARSLEMPRTTVLRKLARLTELGLVVRVGRTYCLTEKVNPPNLRAMAQPHISHIRAALNSLSKMDDQPLTKRHSARSSRAVAELTNSKINENALVCQIGQVRSLKT